MILELMLETLGQYAYRLNNNSIKNTNKTSGFCPEIAKMHNKRLIMAIEPSSDEQFKTLFI